MREMTREQECVGEELARLHGSARLSQPDGVTGIVTVTGIHNGIDCEEVVVDPDGKVDSISHEEAEAKFDTAFPEAVAKTASKSGATGPRYSAEQLGSEEPEMEEEPYMGYTPGEDDRPERGAFPGERFRA